MIFFLHFFVFNDQFKTPVTKTLLRFIFPNYFLMFGNPDEMLSMFDILLKTKRRNLTMTDQHIK